MGAYPDVGLPWRDLNPGWRDLTQDQKDLATGRKQPTTPYEWDFVIGYYVGRGNWDHVAKLWKARIKQEMKAKYPGVDPIQIDALVNDTYSPGALEGADARTKVESVVKTYEGAVPPPLEPEPPPVYEFEKTPEMENLQRIIDESLAAGRPEFTPEYVTQWGETIEKMHAPFEQKAIQKLREEYNLLSPASYGSGTQIEEMGELLNEMAANKATIAMGLGEREYERKLGEYEGAQAKGFGLESFFEEAKKFTSEQEMGDYFAKLKRDWAESDIKRQRGWNVEDMMKQAKMYQDIAKMYDQPKENWWEKPLEILLEKGAEWGAGKIFGL